MIVLLFLLSVFFVYSLLRLVRFIVYQIGLYKSLKSLPGPEFTNPLIGNLPIFWNVVGNRKGVAKRFYQKITELCDTYGREHGFVRLWMGPFVPWIIVCDAKLARKVLTSRFHTNKASYYRMMENFATGTSLFTTPALVARHERRILKEHFTLRYLDSYLPKMSRHLENLVEKIEECIEKEGGIYGDFSNLVSTFIYDTVGDNLFSSHFTSIHTGIEAPYVAAIHEMISWLEIAILQPWRYLFSYRPLLFLLNALNHLSLVYTLPAFKSIYKYHSSVYEIVHARYQKLSGKSGEKGVNLSLVDPTRPSLLDSLLLARVFAPSTGKLAGFIDVMWHMNMFIVAGHDTSTASITWTLYMLAHHQEAQEKARQEAEGFLEELAANGETPNQLNLKRLPYLEACIKETLRLYPVAPFLGRSGTAPLPVSDELSLPANTDITVFYDYVHTQEKYFTDAKAFIPERFTQNSGLANFDASEFAHLNANQVIFPFSLGERSCLGRAYAMSQMKLLFLTLLSRYEMTPTEAMSDLNEEHHFLTKPPRFSVQIRKRSAC